MSAGVASEAPVHWQLPESLASLLSADETTIHSLLPAREERKSEAAQQQPAAKEEVSPFLQALYTSPDTQTTNGAAAFSTTGSALVDLFSDLAPNVTPQKLFALLPKAWDVDPEATLKIIFHARSIHEGKGAKLVFFRCIGWLWDYHPRTLLANLELIVRPTCERKRSKKRDAAREAKTEMLDDDGDIIREEKEYPPRPHGSFDDLNDILVLAINGQLTGRRITHLDSINEALAPASAKDGFKRGRVDVEEGRKRRREGFALAGIAATKTYGRKGDKKRSKESKEAEEDFEPPFAWQLARCGTKKMRDSLIAKRAVEALADPKLQALYLTVVNIYVDYLRSDLDRLAQHNEFLTRPEEERKLEGYGKAGSSPHLFGMSYAGKWAPTPGKSVDKQLLLATALALRLYPNDTVKAARQRFQAEVLTPLRRVLAVPEVKMVHGPWKIDYTNVPALAMTRYQAQFASHDPEGFERYLKAVASGKSTIAGASTMPHMLVSAARSEDSLARRIANLQWDALVESIRSSSDNELSNCIAVADVSGSMGFIGQQMRDPNRPAPIFPCVALSLLLTELARPPWNGAFITFSENPELQRLDMSVPLSERVDALSTSAWGMSTNYASVFKHILAVAKQHDLAPEDMVKKVFVFSDMQFNQSMEEPFGVAEHELVCARFERAGYEAPEIVYWNLNALAAKPVQANTPGTALVSGFNGSLMKYFLRSLSGEEDEAEAEDEDEDEWEQVSVKDSEMTEVAEGEEKGEEKVKKEKVKRTPLDHMKAAINIAPFEGVRVVD